MPSNDYHFVTRWRVQGTPEEVYQILSQPTDLVRWWPAVYLEIKELEPGDADGVGRVISLYTKGWLPYTLHWQARTTEVIPNRRSVLEASGDFTGRGIWTFEPDGDWVNVTYDWSITANKPLLRSLSFLLKPVFAVNHQWAMAKGEESLKLELARRHAPTSEARDRILPPPGPTTTSSIPLLLGVGAVVLLLAAAGYGMFRFFLG